MTENNNNIQSDLMQKIINTDESTQVGIFLFD